MSYMKQKFIAEQEPPFECWPPTCIHCGDVRLHPVEAPDVCPVYERAMAQRSRLVERDQERRNNGE